MKLTKQEQSNISANFISTISGMPKVKCPICGGEKFTLEDETFALRFEDDINRGIRFAVVRCDKCSHSHLFALQPR